MLLLLRCRQYKFEGGGDALAQRSIAVTTAESLPPVRLEPILVIYTV
jgi:hypothetical protein